MTQTEALGQTKPGCFSQDSEETVGNLKVRQKACPKNREGSLGLIHKLCIHPWLHPVMELLARLLSSQCHQLETTITRKQVHLHA